MGRFTLRRTFACLLPADRPAVKPSRPSQPSTALLVEELEEEILLRFPPHEPALLLRASLVYKR
jgi:hypothetical protein